MRKIVQDVCYFYFKLEVRDVNQVIMRNVMYQYIVPYLKADILFLQKIVAKFHIWKNIFQNEMCFKFQ